MYIYYVCVCVYIYIYKDLYEIWLNEDSWNKVACTKLLKYVLSKIYL